MIFILKSSHQINNHNLADMAQVKEIENIFINIKYLNKII